MSSVKAWGHFLYTPFPFPEFPPLCSPLASSRLVTPIAHTSVLLPSLPTGPAHGQALLMELDQGQPPCTWRPCSSHVCTQGKSQVASPIMAIALSLLSPLLFQAIITGKLETLERFICSPQPFPVRALSSRSAGMLLLLILTWYLHVPTCSELWPVISCVVNEYANE